MPPGTPAPQEENADVVSARAGAAVTMTAPVYAVIGVLLLVVGLVAAIDHGGWSWLIPLIGVTLTATSALGLYREPVAGGSRRRLG